MPALLSLCPSDVHTLYSCCQQACEIDFHPAGFFLSALAKKMMWPIVDSVDSLFLSPEYGQHIYDSHSRDRRIVLAYALTSFGQLESYL